MPHFTISVTFLNGTYHGLGDANEPEWPPSPLRLYQALVAVAGLKWGTNFPGEVDQALDWLAQQPPPRIYAPRVQQGIPYQTSVPNNAMDIVAKAWSRGNTTSKDAQPATHKAMKENCPSYLLPDASQPWQQADESLWKVSFVWDIEADDAQLPLIAVLEKLAASLIALGWGLDLVAAKAQVGASSLITGEEWSPVTGAGVSLRVPEPAARQALRHRHHRFRNRISKGTLVPVPPLSPISYRSVSYRRTTDPPAPACAAFSLLEPDGSKPKSYARTHSMIVAAMLRHATSLVAKSAGWDEKTIAQLVLGHGEERGADEHQPVGRKRLAYLPLPSLQRHRRDGEFNHVGAIRRALLYVPAGGYEQDIQFLTRLLSGAELIDQASNQTQALINAIPASDRMIQRYVPMSGAATWTTVTPVILPGRDDHKDTKTEKLLRKAIAQAGYSDELAANALLDWRPVGFLPGAEHVKRYSEKVPRHLRGYPRYHVQLTFRDLSGMEVKVPGPVVLGGGRYYGIGLFVATSK